jgi:hypothetical protein
VNRINVARLKYKYQGLNMKFSATFGAGFAKAVLCIASCCVAHATFASPINTLSDGGFEMVQQSSGYTYLSGTVGSWTYAGLSGLTMNNSLFGTSGAPGIQAAFLQSHDSAISQSFDSSAGMFSVSFLAESRTWGGNLVYVLLDGTRLAFNGNEAVLPLTTLSFTSYESDAIALGAGPHVLTFTGTLFSDVTTFIDNVAINVSDPTTAVPEPGSVALLAIGALGAAGIGRRRRS